MSPACLYRTAVLFAVLQSVALTGCVRRRLTVRTDQPGATISVDNQVIGTSTASTPFTYYGTREVRIEKDNFKTETIRRNIKPPWYQYPVIDVIAESFWPGEIRDERIIDVQLVPETIAEPTEIMERADSLRLQSQNGIVTAPR